MGFNVQTYANAILVKIKKEKKYRFSHQEN
jgi:hypothetical protein